jgi:transposase
MLSPGGNIKIYLFTGYTDMRKGAKTLAYLAQNILSSCELTEKIFVFRGKSADKIKVLWWDGQGYCLFYKNFDRGKFIWHVSETQGSLSITRAQFSMLIEGIDWRMPNWTQPPEYAG